MEVRTISVFILLQIADFVTTMVTIAHGGAETNPFVKLIMGLGVQQGLLIAKLIVIALGIAGAMAGKYKSLKVANMIFACVVIWNLTIIGRLVS